MQYVKRRPKIYEKACCSVFSLTLCLCGCSNVDAMLSRNPYKEEIVLPAIPTQAPNLPTVPQSSEEADADHPQEEVPAGTIAPWETEFNEADYTVKKEEFGEGVAYCWSKGYKNSRQVVYYDNGITEDTYFYPSGGWSHCCSWYADGSYSETRWLDNGEVHTMPDGTKVSGIGTICYSKNIQADGSYEETQFNSEGLVEIMIRQHADGLYEETQYNSEGLPEFIVRRLADDLYEEYRFYPNGNLSKQINDDSAAETYYEQDFYENGMPKCIKSQTPSEEREERYDEEGYLTYTHIKQADYEMEILTDESGKVVLVIENGQTIEDPAVLAQYAKDYHFKN